MCWVCSMLDTLEVGDTNYLYSFGCWVQADGDEETFKAAAAELDLVDLLKADPTFDPEDLPSVPDLLEAEGLLAVSK